MEKTVIPCLLDGTDLPLFLRTLLSCDFHASYEDGLAGLSKALAPGATPVPPAAPPPPPSPALEEATPPAASRAGGALPQPAEDLFRRILQGQTEVLDALGRGDPDRAAAPLEWTATLVENALSRRAQDPEILNLAGYQKKNAYLLRHWNDVQRGNFPPDALLEEAENFFHESLSAKPMNPSAWNGLGSVFLLRGDLDAAEFFVKKALERAEAEGVDYGAAEEDLQTIARLRALRR